jgi:hypothetical protein
MVSTLKDRLTPEEWKAYRSEVNKRYARSEKGKATERRTNASPLAKGRYARYRETPGYAAAQARRREKDQERGWPNQLRHRREVRAASPEMVNAWQAVRWALLLGVLDRPDACERCDAPRRLHAHHGRGYDRDHWIDVDWLCSPCHRIIHR